MFDLIKELFSIRLYKSTQGLKVRRATMIAILVLVASGAFKFTQMSFEGWPLLNDQIVRWMVAGMISLLGWWIAFRLVNWPVFADFLVSVEAEMFKVSWPSKSEVYSSTLVVLTMFLVLALLIFGFDLFWVWVFRWIGVVAT